MVIAGRIPETMAVSGIESGVHRDGVGGHLEPPATASAASLPQNGMMDIECRVPRMYGHVRLSLVQKGSRISLAVILTTNEPVRIE